MRYLITLISSNDKNSKHVFSTSSFNQISFHFHFDGDGIETWYTELTNNYIDDKAFNSFRNVEHIDFDRLLAISIREGIDRATLFRFIINQCASVLATDITGKPNKWFA